VLVLKNVTDQPVRLAQVQLTTILGHYARRILASMLKIGEGVVERLINRLLTYYSNDSAHSLA
jgi:hypothetical protein